MTSYVAIFMDATYIPLKRKTVAKEAIILHWHTSRRH